MPRSSSERAQATVEFVGTLPLLMLGAAACLQALLVAISLLFAQVAADRAARGAPRSRALESMPSAWQERSTMVRRGDTVSVRIRPPAVLPGVSTRLAVQASSDEAT